MEEVYKFSYLMSISNFQVRGNFFLKDVRSFREEINLDISSEITRLCEARKQIKELQLVIDQNQNVLSTICSCHKEFEEESKQIADKKPMKILINHISQNRYCNYDIHNVINKDLKINSELIMG